MKAMILAAGRGERMRPLTDHTPKPLLKIADKPLIVWHIERLVAAGITEIIINHAHLGQQIETTLGNGAQFGATLSYSAETPPALETAGGIAKALPFFANQAFIVINGDIFTDYPIAKLKKHILKPTQYAHLILVANPEHHPYGDFSLLEGTLQPSKKEIDSYTFSGIGFYHPDLFKQVKENTAAKLAPILYQAIAEKQISGEVYQGIWLDVGTPERLEQANQLARNILI